MTELEMYELWRTLRLWANYNQLNQTVLLYQYIYWQNIALVDC